jgi:hypothetical protein
VTIVNAATMSPESWLFAPADPLTAVLVRLPLTTIPPDRPAARLAVPFPISSRLVSTA